MGPRSIRVPQLRLDGYTHITLVSPETRKRTNKLVHRLVCEAFHGPEPFPEAMALHKDHVRTNCAEDNLYWGTRADNTADRVEAGKSHRPKGESNPKAKLSWDLVREIRQKAEEGIPSAQLAVVYNISPTMCWKIIKHRHWKE